MKPTTPMVATALALAACGGASASGPLMVPVGLTRAELAGELRAYEYCPGEPGGESAVYPRCDVPGVEHAQSWVVAHFRDDRVVKLQRWERYAEEPRGLERFNQIIEKRSAGGPPTQEAKDLISAQQELPAGTRTWVAFRAGERTLVGVYLLDPRPPQHATVLEEIVELGADTVPRPRPGRGCVDCAPAE